jgi:hypothetical protein
MEKTTYGSTLTHSRAALADAFDSAQALIVRLREVEPHDLPTAARTQAAAQALAQAAQALHLASFAMLDACAAFDGRTETEGDD